MGILTWLAILIFGIITGCALAYCIVALLYALSNNHGDTTGDFSTFTGRSTLQFMDKQNLKENPKEKNK